MALNEEKHLNLPTGLVIAGTGKKTEWDRHIVDESRGRYDTSLLPNVNLREKNTYPLMVSFVYASF